MPCGGVTYQHIIMRVIAMQFSVAIFCRKVDQIKFALKQLDSEKDVLLRLVYHN